MFENRFYTTKEMYKEYVNKVLCRKIYLASIVLSVIAILTIMASFGENTFIAEIEGIALFIIILTALLSPILALRQLLKLDKKLHNGKNPECIITFDYNIKMVQGNQTISIEYEQVEKIYKLKTCSVLMFSSQNGILYVEDKFSVGNPEDFEKFILEKCTNVEKIEKL